jgi:IclR family acetate operon transcriptional repressor
MAFGLAGIPEKLPARTSRTLTNREILRLHLDEIVQLGYALDNEENDPGVRCISAPVFNSAGDAIGCIGIDGPSVRLTEDKIEEVACLVVAAAQQLSKNIGRSINSASSDGSPSSLEAGSSHQH